MTKQEIKLIAEEAAIDFRRKFDLGQSEPINLDSLLVKLKLLTVFAEMSSNFSGMAAKFGENGFILINCSLPKGRQNFTICHELYHLFIQQDFKFEVMSSNDVAKDENEKLADAFAVELLMPENGIREVLLRQNYLSKNITLDLIIKLEQYFKVSRQAIVYRLINLGLLKATDLEIQNYCNNVADSASKRGFGDTLYIGSKPMVISSDYHEKSNLLYDNELIGLTDYAQLLQEIGIDVFKILDNPK